MGLGVNLYMVENNESKFGMLLSEFLGVSITSLGPIPVSYTHLDVYKRQVYARVNPSRRSIFIAQVVYLLTK